jgi:hypothetical protein
MQHQFAHHLFLAAEVDIERTLSNPGLGRDRGDGGFGKAAATDFPLCRVENFAAGDLATAGFRRRQGAFPRANVSHESVVIYSLQPDLLLSITDSAESALTGFSGKATNTRDMNQVSCFGPTCAGGGPLAAPG